jgi:hypothetical protein
MKPVTFEGVLEAMPRGGHAVEVPATTAAAIGAKHGTRVRGTMGDAHFRSNLANMSGRLILGVHRATVEAAGVAVGTRVTVTMEPDAGLRDTETLPADLRTALRQHRSAAIAWERLAPSRQREYVKAVLEAKRPETRERRVQRTIDELEAPPTPQT